MNVYHHPWSAVLKIGKGRASVKPSESRRGSPAVAGFRLTPSSFSTYIEARPRGRAP